MNVNARTTRLGFHARHPMRKRKPLLVASSSPSVDFLREAKTLVTPDSNSIHVDQYPPFEDWPCLPSLLAGCERGAEETRRPEEEGCTGGTGDEDALRRQDERRRPLDVAVLLSGGVDSSLALHLLVAAGHQVTAFYLQIWFQEDFRNFWDACPWEEDLKYCRDVCDRLGVPLRVVPLTEAYWQKVVRYCISETRNGRTPNPDVLCNSRIKFGAFVDYLEGRTGGMRFDRIASGHYARIDRRRKVIDDETIEEALLMLTPDSIKDQTYFLAHLDQEQLKNCVFPLGYLTKSQVRGLASAANLPNQSRPDSQGLCFLGKVKFSEFIKEHLGEWPGPIIEEETNEIVGYHKGFWFHTIGQRKGLRLAGGPWYVTCKDPRMNAVYVSRQYNEVESLDMTSRSRSSFYCTDFSWTSSIRPNPTRHLYCKVRHGPRMYRCTLDLETMERNKLVGHVKLDGVDQGLADGQYVVFYQDDVCLGCALIHNVPDK